jgi:hypothetical protein
LIVSTTGDSIQNPHGRAIHGTYTSRDELLRKGRFPEEISVSHAANNNLDHRVRVGVFYTDVLCPLSSAGSYPDIGSRTRTAGESKETGTNTISPLLQQGVVSEMSKIEGMICRSGNQHLARGSSKCVWFLFKAFVSRSGLVINCGEVGYSVSLCADVSSTSTSCCSEHETSTSPAVPRIGSPCTPRAAPQQRNHDSDYRK